MLELILEVLAFAALLLAAAGLLLAGLIVVMIIILAIDTAFGQKWSLDIDLLFLMMAPVAGILVCRAVFGLQDLTAPPTPFELVVAAVIFLLTGFAVLITGFVERWAPWRPPTGNLLFFRGFETVLAWIALTEGFTALLLLLGQVGAISIDPPIAGSPVSDSSEPNPWPAAEAILVWNLLDMIPSLKVPATLNWTLDHNVVDTAGGSVVLAYKILVVLPVIGVVKILLKPPALAPDDEPVPDSPTQEEEEEEEDVIRRMKAAGGTGPTSSDQPLDE